MASTQTQAAAVAAATGASGAVSYAITVNVIPDNETIFLGDQKKEDLKVEPKKQENLEPTPATFSAIELSQNYKGKLLISKFRKANLSKLPLTKEERNQTWWKWAYENKYLKLTQNKDPVKLDDVFKELNKPYGHEDTDKSLSKACETAYRKPDTEFKYGNQDYLVKNIGEFCTKGNEPLDVSEPEAIVHTIKYTSPPYGNGVLAIDQNKNKFVTKDEQNQVWWNWSFTKFFSQQGLNDHFSLVTSAFNKTSRKTNNKDTTLNFACDNAYKKQPKDLTSLNLFENIKKFCSVGAIKENVKFPDWEEPKGVRVLVDPKATNFPEGVASVEFNKNYLIDPAQENSDKKQWWEWAYLFRYKPEVNKSKLPDPFKKIEFGFSSEEKNKERALNQACKDSYTKNKATVESGVGNYQLLEVIKRFCTTTEYANSTTPLTKPDK